MHLDVREGALYFIADEFHKHAYRVMDFSSQTQQILIDFPTRPNWVRVTADICRKASEHFGKAPETSR